MLELIKKKEPEETEEIILKRVSIERLAPDGENGLTHAEVELRRESGWSNITVDSSSKTTKDIIKENVLTYFNLIFLILAILLITVGSYRDLTFLPIIIANTLIGIAQEIRAKKVLDEMNMLNSPKATVIRGGVEETIDIQDLVIDDIVIFKGGSQICADAIVIDGEVQVNESLLTGEADEIIKKPGDDLMSGSFIVSGQCRARLDKVGADSYIAKLTLEAKTMKGGEKSEMIRALDRLVKIVGVIIVPIAIILFCQSYFYNDVPVKGSITSTIAAIIGMIPEGLYLLASVALAVSSIRLAQQKVLLHDMKSIETLARVNVLCVDKTGTITEGAMRVKRLIPASHYDSETMPPLNRLLSDFAVAMDRDNITMEAIKETFTVSTGREALKVQPFSSVTKYSAVTFADEVFVLGAPEFVLREDYAACEEELTEYGRQGYRVLVFGSYAGGIDGKALTEKVTPLAYLLLSNAVRKEAKQTFKYFAEQGVEVKVISGDNPVTVSEVAKEAGIQGAENYVDASTLTTDRELAAVALNTTVFGRVSPEQKRVLVRSLKEMGKTVAMTGDGVNDVLALKDADCSIAMASGSEAATQVAQVVLLDSNFSRMPSVVLEGRRVVNNIQRSASLFLVKNIFSLLLALFSAVSMIKYPLTPSQISLISLFTIGTPAFFLALEPNKNRIEGKFLPNVFFKALPAALTDVIIVASLVVFGQVFGVGSTDISTASTLLLAAVGFMIMYKISCPMNFMRLCVLIGCIIGLLFCSLFMSDLFSLSNMSTKCIMLLVLFSVATEPVLRYSSLLLQKIRNIPWDRIKFRIQRFFKEKFTQSRQL